MEGRHNEAVRERDESDRAIFKRERYIAWPDFFDPGTFTEIRSEVERVVAKHPPERTSIPTYKIGGHKKGGTVAYDTLQKENSPLVEIYRDPRGLRKFLAEIIGVQELLPTPDTDLSSLSILCYEKPGDHIDYHYDHNFYRGRHFTALLGIDNCGRKEGTLSSARLLVKKKGGEIEIPTPPNALVAFEGNKTLHKATPIAEGERRTILSMTYCTDPRASMASNIARRIKDVAFFGLRAITGKKSGQ